jgi:ABC-type Na+ efflux pump permease subunit
VRKNILQQRYGRDRFRNRDRILAISIAAVALTSFLIWAIFVSIDNSNQVTHRDIAYEVIDEYSTNVTFEVSRNPGQAVSCDLTVLNQSFAIVGFLTVDVAASESRSTVISSSIRTTELGVSGLVDGCR